MGFERTSQGFEAHFTPSLAMSAKYGAAAPLRWCWCADIVVLRERAIAFLGSGNQLPQPQKPACARAAKRHGRAGRTGLHGDLHGRPR